MKVYLRADENEAGVTVEEAGDNGCVTAITTRDEGHLRLYDHEARAVVEGLLRRMLEKHAFDSRQAYAIRLALGVLEEGR